MNSARSFFLVVMVGFLGFFPSFGCAVNMLKIQDIRPEDIFSILNKQTRDLAIAATEGDVESIERFKRNNANFNAAGKYGMTPLFCALLAKNKKGFVALLEYGADPNHVDDAGVSPIHIATAYVDDVFFLETLLEHGGNPNLIGHQKSDFDPFANYMGAIGVGEEPPMHLAAEKNTFLGGGSGLSDNAIKKMEILLQHGADIDIESNGYTPLISSVTVKNYDRAYFLISNGANCNNKTEQGNTLSHFYNANPERDPAIGTEQYMWREKFVVQLKKICNDEWAKLHL